MLSSDSIKSKLLTGQILMLEININQLHSKSDCSINSDIHIQRQVYSTKFHMLQFKGTYGHLYCFAVVFRYYY